MTRPELSRRRAGGPAQARKRGPYAKSQETRDRILNGALEVAGRVGLHRTSVAAVAEAAGVAVGNVPYHFGSREELLHELMEWVAHRLLDDIERALQTGGDAMAREEASLRAYLGFVRRHPAYVRLVEEVRLHHPELYRQTMTLWLELIRGALAEAGERGEIRPLDDAERHAVAFFILGSRYFVDQMMAGVDGRPYPGDDVVIASYLCLLREGLAPAGAGAFREESP